MAEFEIPKFKYKGNLANIKEMAGGSDLNYTSSVIEKIIIERNEKVDNAILGEIQKIANEEGIETKIILNKNAIADALRKQIPINPIFVDTRFRNHGRRISDGCSIAECYECPNCKSHIFHVFDSEHYCIHCGQALDWRKGGE